VKYFLCVICSSRSFHTALLLMFLLILSGCSTTVGSQTDDFLNLQQLNHTMQEELATHAERENTLINREAAVSARETELVSLFSELLKEKMALELYQDELRLNERKNTARKNIKSSVINKKPTPTKATDGKNSRVVLGELENVFLDPPGMHFSARIDTGAKTSSINALDIVEFERDGKPYVKFQVLHPKTNKKIELTRRIRKYVRIKEHDRESQRRPIVRLRIKLANIDERINFTLVDRSNFKQQVLIGRNFLRDLAVVDVSKEYTTTADDTYETK
jgi:hypothetical protein